MGTDWKQVGLALAAATAHTAEHVLPLSGKGDKLGADHLAVETLRAELQSLPYRMMVVIGEGEKDRAPMLYSGERLGSRSAEAPGLDLIVDPLECTTNFARGLPDSMVVVAATTEGTVQPIPGTYMEQLLVPPAAAGLLEADLRLDSSPAALLPEVAAALGRKVEDVTVVVQDRPRHKELIEGIRTAGAGVALIDSGSISAALEITSSSSGRLNLMWGIFGAPEGLVIAFLAALSGAGFLGRIRPHDPRTEEETRLLRLYDRTLSAQDWVQGQGVLVCSGLHASAVLPGAEWTPAGVRVHTLLWTHGHRSIATHLAGQQSSVEEF